MSNILLIVLPYVAGLSNSQSSKWVLIGSQHRNHFVHFVHVHILGIMICIRIFFSQKISLASQSP